MIDHLVGRPSPSWKRIQVFLVIFFWVWRIRRGNSKPPRIMWLRQANRTLQRYTPWQVIVSTLTALYAIRNLDKIFGLGSPEPLARLYSTSYYRATWINTGLEAGFATAMTIRPKWLRDICSILFSGYYILYANEADEKLRRFRAVPTVETLRTTWEKSTNPYIRMVVRLPSISVRRKMLLSRPKSSKYTRPIAAYLFFESHEAELCHVTDLILDFPGGGFVAMSPEHHEERLRAWAVTTGKPVLSIDYGKAPEYPYPFAIDEAYDTYRTLVESDGTVIGMAGGKLNVIISGDSAGATLAVNVVLKILEINQSSNLPQNTSRLPLPVSLVLSYAALDFNFTSWMSPANLKVLQSEQSSGNLPGLSELVAQKDHLQHISPLSMVTNDRSNRPRRHLSRNSSWKDTIRGLTMSREKAFGSPPGSASTAVHHDTFTRRKANIIDDECASAEVESGGEDSDQQREEDRPIRARIRYSYHAPTPPVFGLSGSAFEKGSQELLATGGEADREATGTRQHAKEKGKVPIGTRLTMTSRTGFFQDRVVSPSMMRAMAILYIGPHRNPDFATDYHISPILAPNRLLAQFPPLLMQCGEKDPFVDDTVIFAGRLREAKRAHKHKLELALSRERAGLGEVMDEKTMTAMKNERDKLSAETEEDWVQMVLFSDWSHGYLQMPTLMKEAKGVIEDLALWMADAFAKRAAVQEKNGPCSAAPGLPGAMSSLAMDESGITFVPKKLKDISHSDDETQAHQPPVNGHGTDCSLGTDGKATRRPEALVAHLNMQRSTPQAAETPRSAAARQAGTPISETELMRRRRLLDFHIFDSDAVQVGHSHDERWMRGVSVYVLDCFVQ